MIPLGIPKMKFFSAALAGGLLSVIAGAAIADPALTRRPSNLLAAPSGKSQVLLHIPADAAVDVVDCQKAWCEISWRDEFGFVPQANLDIGAVPEGGFGGPRPRAYYEPAPVYAYPPATVWGGGFVIGPRPRVWGYHHR